MVRPSPTKPGKYELVYGHNRLEAAKRSGLTEAGFLIRTDITDEQMLLRMDQENRETWGTDIRSTIEAVRGVVSALAGGQIAGFTIKPFTPGRYIYFAPSFVPGRKPNTNTFCAYTLRDVAKKLERTQKDGRGDFRPTPEIVAAMGALSLIERGLLQENTLYTVNRETGLPLSTKTVQQLVDRLESQYPLFLETIQKQRTGTVEQGKQIQKQLDTLRAEERRDEQDTARLAEEYVKAEKKQILEEVKETQRKLAQKTQERAEREKRRRDLEAQQKAFAKTEEAQRKEEARQKQIKEEREENNWRSFCKTLVDKLNLGFSTSDPLYADLKRWRENPRVTPNQRGAVALALHNFSNRIAEFNPNATAPSANADAAMKTLKAKAKRKRRSTK